MTIGRKIEIVLSVLKVEGEGYKMPNRVLLEKIADAADKEDRATVTSIT